VASTRRMEVPSARRIRSPFPGQNRLVRITRILYSTRAAGIKSYGSGLSYRVHGGPAGRSAQPEEAVADSTHTQFTRKQ
jgi:hypothetical protein